MSSLIGDHTDFKFGVQVDHSKSQPTDEWTATAQAAQYSHVLLSALKSNWK